MWSILPPQDGGSLGDTCLVWQIQDAWRAVLNALRAWSPAERARARRIHALWQMPVRERLLVFEADFQRGLDELEASGHDVSMIRARHAAELAADDEYQAVMRGA